MKTEKTEDEKKKKSARRICIACMDVRLSSQNRYDLSWPCDHDRLKSCGKETLKSESAAEPKQSDKTG